MRPVRMYPGCKYFKDGDYSGYVTATHFVKDKMYGRYTDSYQTVDREDKFWLIEMHEWEEYNEFKFYPKSVDESVLN